MQNKPDFTQVKYFPGTHGNRFDVILRVMDTIESLPALLFAAILFLIALLPTLGRWEMAILLWAFVLGDWVLLAALPRFGKSYGPAKPPLLVLALLRAALGWFPLLILLLLQIAGTLLVIYAFWIEPHRLTVTRQSLRSAKLKPGQPVRILHLGDLHLERITGRERRLNDLIRSLNADLILFSGDFLNLSYIHDPEAQRQVREIVKDWAAPLGVYAVSGSPAVDQETVVPSPLLDGLPVCWLGDQKITIAHNGQTFDVAGLTCSHKPFVDGPKLRQVLNRTDPAGLKDLPGLERFTLLLYHTPDLILEAAEAGVDLQLSGHTHGGQVRLPFFGALITASLYGKRFEVGRKQVEGTTLYVTRGIGMEGKGAPRARFLCPPEIILWEISG
jgi:hypothetical protein